MKQKMAAPPPGAGPGAGRIFGALLAGLAMALCVVNLVVVLFVRAVAQNTALPAAGPVSGTSLTAFLETPYAIAAAAVPVAVFALCLILLLRRVRGIFLSLGVWVLVAAALLILLGWQAAPLVQQLPGSWREVFAETTRVFRTCTALCALVLTAVSATALSVYACIAAVKGGRREKVC